MSRSRRIQSGQVAFLTRAFGIMAMGSGNSENPGSGVCSCDGSRAVAFVCAVLGWGTLPTWVGAVAGGGGPEEFLEPGVLLDLGIQGSSIAGFAIGSATAAIGTTSAFSDFGIACALRLFGGELWTPGPPGIPVGPAPPEPVVGGAVGNAIAAVEDEPLPMANRGLLFSSTRPSANIRLPLN
jgi:hypothetical protein